MDANKILNELKIYATKAKNQRNNFTPSHTKYQVNISRKNQNFTVTYQQPTVQGTKDKQRLLHDVLYCVISDAECYFNSKNITDFAQELGYENSYDKQDEIEKIYRACQHQYQKLHKLFSEEEYDALREYFRCY